MAARGEELLGRTIALVDGARRAACRSAGPSHSRPRPRRALVRPDEARARSLGDRGRRPRGRGDLVEDGDQARAREPRHADPAGDDRRHGGRASAIWSRHSSGRSRSEAETSASPGARPRSGASSPRSLSRHATRSSRRARPSRPSTRQDGRPPRRSHPYPPGIPAIAPGEVVSGELLAALREAAAHGTRIAYCADPTLRTIEVVAR